MLARARDPREISRGPGILEIEAAGDAVDVEDFAREMQPSAFPTFHGLEVDLGQLYAAAGDELVLEHALAVDLEFRGGEIISKSECSLQNQQCAVNFLVRVVVESR